MNLLKHCPAVTLGLLAVPLLTGCGTGQATAVSQGLAGPAGPAGVPGLVFRNAYSSGTAYGATDVVTYQGSSFVALTANTGVRPLGDPASAVDWAVLAQAGATGAVGAPGVPGPQGVAGAQGAAGMPGVQGIPGATGAPGIQGATGVAGPQGPTGAAGPMGPVGAAGADLVSFLRGRRFGVQGDSISAAFGNAWQNVVIARTGMALVSQDARSGRRFDQAFECYGTVTPGSQLGVFALTNAPYCASTAGTNGSTLAQNLANVDVEIIELGTNDEAVPLGMLGDGTAAGTFYGNMRWVVETYLTAKPSMRLVMVTAQRNAFASPATVQSYVNAMVAYGNSMGVPVINMYTLGGLNDVTQATLTVDGTHPSAYGFSNFYGPVIAQKLQQLY